ncbi:MAG: hypothetical protein HY722_01365 [Planctomycetes bacterium]|nr:hypothetical protein [Planctomycetota bacterium]
MTLASPLDELVGTEVVLDVRGPMVYLGRLAQVHEDFLSLEGADVHFQSDASSTKEVYVMEAKRYGVRRNRERVWVRAEEVVSVSALSDVVEY